MPLTGHTPNSRSMTGYSGTALSQKLGIKPGARVKTKGAPAGYESLIAPLPAGAFVSSQLRGPVDILHIFSTSRANLQRMLKSGLSATRPHGAIWVSWPKKASGVSTDLTEDVIRQVALPMGLVDVKVCAVDETWSGLKLVLRKDRRR